MHVRLLLVAGLSTSDLFSFKSDYYYFFFISFSTKSMNYLSESVMNGMSDIICTRDYVAISWDGTSLITLNLAMDYSKLKVNRYQLFWVEVDGRGFDSNITCMYGLDYLRGVWNPFQQQSYHPLNTVLLIFDGSDSPLGYGVLDFQDVILIYLFW